MHGRRTDCRPEPTAGLRRPGDGHGKPACELRLPGHFLEARSDRERHEAHSKRTAEGTGTAGTGRPAKRMMEEQDAMPDRSAAGFCAIEEALDELRAGRMIVLVDDEHRENEGDLVLAAESITPQAVNFIIRHACGRLCVPMSRPVADQLGLELLPGLELDPSATPFTRNFDARHGVTTGISAQDRCRTIQVCADPRSAPNDLVRDKGHMDGLVARAGGVLVRAGHTEGVVDLCRLAGFREVGVLCEILNEDGTMARLPDLRAFCDRHTMKMATISDLIEHRRRREKLIKREIALKLPTEFGTFDLFAYSSMVDQEPHLALTLGGIGVESAPGVVPVQEQPVLVRMHSE